jgi:hypothetical protein
VQVLWSILIDSHRHPALLKLKLWNLWRSSQQWRVYIYVCERSTSSSSTPFA